MKTHFKNLFIPHGENGFHPHIFHRKRIVFYALFLLAVKAFLVSMIMFVPMDVYSSPIFLEEERDRILELVNQEREKVEIEGLNENDKLNESSALKVEDMVKGEYFSHHGPNGEDLKHYIDAAGYKYILAGENLAVGFYDPQDIIDAWVASPSHYENIVENQYEDTGLSVQAGVYKGKQTFYVANHFGDPLEDDFHGTAKIDFNGLVLSEEISKPGFYAKAKYYLAKNTSFEPLKNIFKAGNGLNLFFLIVFSIAFVLNIAIEIKTQHIHVIRDAIMLIALILLLYLV